MKFKIHTAVFILSTLLTAPVLAQQIPGSADAGRIDIDAEALLERPEGPPIILKEAAPEIQIFPEGAEAITFRLNEIIIEGLTAFPEEEISDFYSDLIDTDIPLSRLWEIAADITRRYQAEGYFLSRAYVPQQEIENGSVKISITEGYIGEVDIQGLASDHRISKQLSERLSTARPIKLQQLERALLLFNDFPGLEYEAVLDRIDDTRDGAIRLVLRGLKEKGRGVVSVSNHGSRFTGPHRSSFAYEDSIAPFHQTTISGTASIPGGKEVWSANARHVAQVLPTTKVFVVAGLTETEPGYTLAANDLESTSTDLDFGTIWQVLKQRDYSLELGARFITRNVDTDILDTPLTRDRIRALRGHLNYTVNDSDWGNNQFDLTLSRGLEVFGASKAGDQNLSRTEAEPDFTKLEANWVRQSWLDPNLLLLTTIRGQLASKALYSSEEFGFGGPYQGRAYDSSEITGDHGIAASLQLQWTGLPRSYDFLISPYVFYDIGKIWNIDDGQEKTVSAANTGIGLDLNHTSGLFGNLTVAVPLTKDIDTPIYGGSDNQRLFFQLGYRY